ncbi:MAG: glycoside hydrolase family 99-like domain-containing protein [Hyphomonas sp.]|nr:glycoside hydrolase family 99-like domain-containing protein [Hyphomonas sp.]
MQPVRIELQPYYQLEADGEPGWWRATDVDPQFLVSRIGASGPFRRGHYYFEIVCANQLVGLINPCLYVDYGRGLNGHDRISLVFQRVTGDVYRAYVSLWADVALMRFDPTELRLRFHIAEARLVQVSRIHWYLSAAWLVTTARLTGGRSPRDLAARAVDVLKSGGPTALAAAIRGSIATPLVETRTTETPSVASALATMSGAPGADTPFANLYFNQSMMTEGYRDPRFAAGRAHVTDGSRCDVKLIAYYLPQFHPFPENNEWWGKGFTEWTNVTKALPRFEGHYQPKLPADLGFYDLRNVDVMREQAQLAKTFGLTGFCFHFYWFGGKRLMETPILNFRAAEDIDFQYSLCWANENWSRRWDGAEHELLIGQSHSPEDDIAFIKYVSRYFEDRRYIKIDGRPVLTVYRPDILPDPKGTVERWRKTVKELGFPDVYLVATTAFGFTDYKRLGFDALSEFPPHAIYAREMVADVKLYDSRYAGAVLDYQTVVTMQLDRSYPEGVVFPGVMPAWDNVARRPLAGNVFHGSTPEAYRTWLRFCADRARKNPENERFVFINAWNEWAEGAYLEPDRLYGHAYLWATASVIDELSPAAEDVADLIERHNARFKPAGQHAVAAHLFYPDVAADLAASLPRPDALDVYVSVPETIGIEALSDIMERLPRSYILAAPNCGRDILPFLKLMPIINRHDYAWICKVHGKKSVHLGQGSVWRNQIFEALLGGLQVKGNSTSHTELPKSPEIGMVGPRNSLVSLSEQWVVQNNAEPMQVLLRKLNIEADIRSGSFVAGSMFWFRPDALKMIVDAGFDDADFGLELGRIDGTPAHAMERLFGIIATRAGYALSELQIGKVTVAFRMIARESGSRKK